MFGCWEVGRRPRRAVSDNNNNNNNNNNDNNDNNMHKIVQANICAR